MEGQRGRTWTAKGKGEAGNIGILGRRQVTPRWENDHVRRQDGHRWGGCRGRIWLPPPEGHPMAGGEVGAVQE